MKKLTKTQVTRLKKKIITLAELGITFFVCAYLAGVGLNFSGWQPVYTSLTGVSLDGENSSVRIGAAEIHVPRGVVHSAVLSTGRKVRR